MVDDDADICRFISTALAGAGYRAVCASSGDAALTAVETEKPDLVLLDVHMPGIDGWHVLDQLRARGGPQQAIVMMTGQYEGQDRALASGAQGYLAKPFDLDELLACVDLHPSLLIESDSDERFVRRPEQS